MERQFGAWGRWLLKGERVADPAELAKKSASFLLLKGLRLDATSKKGSTFGFGLGASGGSSLFVDPWRLSCLSRVSPTRLPLLQ